MSVTNLHIFGWEKETELVPRLEELFGERLRKFEERYAQFDFETDDYSIEIKCRRPPITEDTYNTWYVPCCKFVGASKEVICFYYFEQTKKLYYIIYDPQNFALYDRVRNRNGQLTYGIPRDDWTLVD